MSKFRPTVAPDLLLVGAVGALCSVGLTMILSASSATAGSYATMAYFWQQQCLGLGVGVLCAVVVYRAPSALLRRVAPLVLLVAIAGLVLTFIPHVGARINGVYRWLRLGRWSVQPSEFAKLALVLYLAAYLGDREPKEIRISKTIAALIPIGAMVALVLAEPDLGTAMILSVVGAAVLFVGGINLFYLATVSVAGVGVAVVMVQHHAQWMARIMAFVNPWRDPQNTGFHIIQSLYALGSGGLTGVGLGASSEKFYYLPEQYTDFIFSVLGEELGIVGTVAVLLLFLIVAYRSYRIALRAPDGFGRLLAIGCATMIVVQAFVNIGVVTSSLPVTGVPLPFISFGGSSLVVSLMAVALVAGVGRDGALRAMVQEHHRRFRVVEGAGGKPPAPVRRPVRAPVGVPVPILEPAAEREEALWALERAILDASFAFETSVHAPSEAREAWLAARSAASRFGEIFQANSLLLPQDVLQELVVLHRRFTEIFEAYFRHLVATNGDTRAAFARARANGDLVLGDISHSLEVVEAALRREPSSELIPIEPPLQRARINRPKRGAGSTKPRQSLERVRRRRAAAVI